jgi:hypothetical protein
MSLRSRIRENSVPGGGGPPNSHESGYGRRYRVLFSWTAHVRLPYKPEAPASEHFATHSLAGASGLYSQWFS